MYYPPNKPRAKGPSERIATRDSVGKLKYLQRTTWRNSVTGKDAPRMRVMCDPDLGGCGAMMDWSGQEFARRRRRWAREGLTPQCKACEDREQHPDKYVPLWQRNSDVVALDKLHTLWRAILHDRTRMDRTMKGNRKELALLYGGGFCDALQFHIDRRWTSVFDGNPDPFSSFQTDVSMPPEGKPYLLRRDPYGPMCKANCYWGTATDRRVNRSDNPTALRDLGTKIVRLPDKFGEGANVYRPYAVVQGSRHDPRLAKRGELLAEFV